MTQESPGLIYKKIIEVMKKTSAIGKGRKNETQKYNFRGIDDVYNEFHDHLAEAGVFSVPTVLDERTEERLTKSGSALIYRVLKIKYRFYADDGSFIETVVVGEGMDLADKASNKAMSVAHKYAFLQIFAIGTEDAKDPENDSPGYSPDPDKNGIVPKNKQSQPPPMPQPEPFDKANKEHLAKLHERLKAKDIPEKDWHYASNFLHGKMPTKENLLESVEIAKTAVDIPF